MINGELIVDNFAGGGGASTGIELATGYSVDIAINHDPEAIRMHQTNHPNTKHYCEDVWMVDPVKVCNGRPVGLAWFSPDCKHFSKAKGGKPKDKNIRGLAWVACRWAGLVRPRVIMLENVEEFKGWGPLNRQHHPIKAKRGTTFQKFVHQLNDLGYEVQYRELIAADYGAPTTRKRFFLIARCDGKPIVWPSPTHAPADSPEVKNGHLKPYLGAYTQIDFQRPCPSIFDTAEEIKEKYGIRAQRPLSPKTMERIARGIQKYILENPEPFLVQCNHGGDRKAGDLHIPLPTITAKNGYGIVRPTLAPCKSGKISAFLHKYYSGGYKGAGECMKNPLPTVTAWDHNSIVAATLVQMNNHCDGMSMIHAICDFCGKDCDRTATLLSMTPFQNFARYHTDNEPYGNREKTRSFVICYECCKKHNLPNPYETYSGITKQEGHYEKCLDNYTDVDLVEDKKYDKRFD